MLFFMCRNLCIDGGHDICAEMYNKNILAPLRLFPSKVYDLTLLHPIFADWPFWFFSSFFLRIKISAAVQQSIEDPKATSELTQRLVSDFAENVITIFWCLAWVNRKTSFYQPYWQGFIGKHRIKHYRLSTKLIWYLFSYPSWALEINYPSLLLMQLVSSKPGLSFSGAHYSCLSSPVSLCAHGR